MKRDVYVLEDDPGIGELIALLLTEQGYGVRLFSTIASLNRQISDSLPALLIIDVMLPDGNGLDVCQALKTDSRTQAVPILVMSAYEEYRHDTRADMADGFISKPFDITLFLADVQRQIA